MQFKPEAGSLPRWSSLIGKFLGDSQKCPIVISAPCQFKMADRDMRPINKQTFLKGENTTRVTQLPKYAISDGNNFPSSTFL